MATHMGTCIQCGGEIKILGAAVADPDGQISRKPVDCVDAVCDARRRGKVPPLVTKEEKAEARAEKAADKKAAEKAADAKEARAEKAAEKAAAKKAEPEPAPASFPGSTPGPFSTLSGHTGQPLPEQPTTRDFSRTDDDFDG